MLKKMKKMNWGYSISIVFILFAGCTTLQTPDGRYFLCVEYPGEVNEFTAASSVPAEVVDSAPIVGDLKTRLLDIGVAAILSILGANKVYTSIIRPRRQLKEAIARNGGTGI